MQWVHRIDLLVQILVEEDGTIVSASGTRDGWHLRLLFPTRESLTRTYEYCQSNRIGCELRSVYNINEGRQGRFGLTDAQHDTMTAAFEHGYYEIPRELDTEELTTEFDISHQALFERLRRGHKVLVKNTFMIGSNAPTMTGRLRSSDHDADRHLLSRHVTPDSALHGDTTAPITIPSLTS